MVSRWKLCGFLLLLWWEFQCVSCAERARSTILSVNLKRKLKHHHHHNKSVVSPTASTTTNPEDEGKEFTLRSTSYAYVMELDLGTPRQTIKSSCQAFESPSTLRLERQIPLVKKTIQLEFLIDTGSSNMAIAGPRCADQFGNKCQIDTFYYPSRSSTAVDLHIPIETEYGKGAWSGDVYRDVVSFPGDGPTTVAEFAVIRNERDFFLRNSINEGIMGLAYKSLATDDVEPLYDQLVKDGKVPNLFALGLCSGTGKMWLEMPESWAYHGPIHYTEIGQETWYSVVMTGIDVAGNSLGLSASNFPNAIVDSGTTDILLQPAVYLAVIAELKAHGPPVDDRFWRNYCVDTDPYQWPYITIYLKDTRGGSFALTVLGKHYVRKQDQFYCLSIGAKRSGAVLGEVVMEGNIVVFDRANDRIGFAPSNLSHPDLGPCGNPLPVNNTLRGKLSKYCHAPDMPGYACQSTCVTCIDHGGVWCPQGHVIAWINGVKSVLDTEGGFCWQGGLFNLDNTKVETFLKSHGSAEFQATCDSTVPMYKQCKVEGVWVMVISGSIMCLLLFVVMFFCCKRAVVTTRDLPAR